MTHCTLAVETSRLPVDRETVNQCSSPIGEREGGSCMNTDLKYYDE